MPRRSPRAYSLAEIVLALGLLSLMLLTVAMLFGRLASNSSKASNKAVGATIAEEVMNQVIQEDLYAKDLGVQSESQYATDAEQKTKFFYQVESNPVTTLEAGNGYSVKVRVWWWSEAPGQTRGLQGRQDMELERLILR